MLFQVNLLWVAALHRHEADGTTAPPATTLHRANRPQQPAAESPLLCTACQIVRHAAARTSTSAPAPEARGSVFFLSGFAISTFHSHQPTALYGRAPPLA
jgi:hypothetical protein